MTALRGTRGCFLARASSNASNSLVVIVNGIRSSDFAPLTLVLPVFDIDPSHPVVGASDMWRQGHNRHNKASVCACPCAFRPTSAARFLLDARVGKTGLAKSSTHLHKPSAKS